MSCYDFTILILYIGKSLLIGGGIDTNFRILQ